MISWRGNWCAAVPRGLDRTVEIAPGVHMPRLAGPHRISFSLTLPLSLIQQLSYLTVLCTSKTGQRYVSEAEKRTRVSPWRLGLGTFRARGDDVKTAVTAALACGYTHIDTASVYKNEEDIADALEEFAARRLGEGAPPLDASPSSDPFTASDVFITSKLSPYEMGTARARTVGRYTSP